VATVVEIALRAIDQASSAIEAVMGTATDAAETAASAYQAASGQIDQASRSAAAAVEAVGDSAQTAGDEMSDSMDKAGQSAQGLGDVIKRWLSDPINQLGTGVTAVGLGLSKLTGDTFEVSSAMDRAAIVTGLTAEQMRKLTYSNANAGLSVSEIAATVEELGSRGRFTEEEIAGLVNSVDLLTDALGGDMVANLDSADRSLAAFDIPLTQINEHMDTLTFLEKQTSVGLAEFGQYMSRVAPEIKGAGLSMEDVAVALAGLEASGIRGRPAITLLTQALIEAQGNADMFWESLGVGESVLEMQRVKLEETAGMTERLADANEKNLGWYDALKSKIDVAKTALGDYVQPLDDVGQALTAAGPAILAVNQANDFLSSGIGKNVIPMVTKMGSSLMSLATNPVVLVAAAIAGLVALIVTNWDWVKEKTLIVWGAIKEHIVTPIQDAWDWLVGAWEKIEGFLSRTWEGIKTTAATVWEAIVGVIKAPINAIITAVNWMIRGLNQIKFSIPSWVPILGGKSFGFNLKEIPMLAEGALLTGPTLFLGGEAGDEAVLPLDRIVPLVAEGVRSAGGAGGGESGPVYITVMLDGRVITRSVLPHMHRQIQLKTGVA
jgi:hypothetical protein